MCAIMGASGAGKSTFISLITGKAKNPPISANLSANTIYELMSEDADTAIIQ
jgi:ABC-type lipoprotein export system ATPase subunit